MRCQLLIQFPAESRKSLRRAACVRRLASSAVSCLALRAGVARLKPGGRASGVGGAASARRGDRELAGQLVR
eukprot:4853256-Pleurochrysis_carterae.AAC.1